MGADLERELRLRAIAVAAATRRARPTWRRRLVCMVLGHAWRHAWGPSVYAPVVCARCGTYSGTGSAVTLLGRHARGESRGT